MKFRWKLLILLLSISIVPIAGSRLFGVNAVKQMGDQLVSQSRTRIVADTEDRLRLLVDTYSLILWRGREHVETVLMMQADEVERAIRQNAASPKKVFFARDFNRGVDLPADTVASERHFKNIEHGGMELLNVSYAEQVFKLAPGTGREQVAADIARLAALTPVYRRLHKRLEGICTWQYTVLENGLHSAYPGHNGIPERLDFRNQPWYRQAKTHQQVPWTDPYVDPETRQIVVAAAKPVLFPDGRTAGVTAVIVPISQLLNERLLADNIPAESRAFLCYIADRPETGRLGARIFARDDPEDITHRSWRSNQGSDWLESKDERQFQAMLDDVMAGTGNLRRMSHQQCRCIWAYGPIQGGAFLVVIIPEAQVLKPVRESEADVQNLIDRLIRMTGYGVMGVVLLITVVAFAFARTVTQPIRALVEGAKRLAEGRFDTRVHIRSNDEFGEMGKVFNAVVPRMEEHYRMSRSMALAREVQQSLLPKTCPSVAGLDIAGTAISCDETGGDYYDFLDIGRKGAAEKTGVVVGDVSDHGLPSALLMASARAYMRQRASMPGTLSNIVSDVNRQLERDVADSGRFMTLFYSEIDARERIIRWVRAGHDPGMIYDPASGRFEVLAGRGLPLGIDGDTDYEESERRLTPGQVIVIGTDGIWEAHNPDGEMFGKERLQRIVQAHADDSATVILDTVISALEAFRRSAVQDDDVTLVVIKITRD